MSESIVTVSTDVSTHSASVETDRDVSTDLKNCVDRERLEFDKEKQAFYQETQQQKFEHDKSQASARQKTEDLKVEIADKRYNLEVRRAEVEMTKVKQQSASYAMRTSALHASKITSIQLGLMEVLGYFGVELETGAALELAGEFAKVLLGEQQASASVVLTE